MFDGDAVLFDEESERIYQQDGMEAFFAHEKKNINQPLPDGPFAKLLKTISMTQREYAVADAPMAPMHKEAA